MKQISKVFEAAKTGANTTRDIVDVTGLPMPVASSIVSSLIEAGVLRRIDRKIPQTWGPPLLCFEVVTGLGR